MQSALLIRVRGLDRLYDGFEDAGVFGGNQDGFCDVVDGEELERVEQERDVRQREETLRSIATHWLEDIVE